MNALKTAVLIGLFAFSAHLYAEDTNPPTWRGDELTTYQYWEFNTSDNPLAPDNPGGNPYGDVQATVTGNFPFTQWLDTHEGYQGVWQFEDYILLEIPNNPAPNDYKEVWIQITYYAEEAANPEILSVPALSGEVQVLEKTELPLQPGATLTYWHATYLLTIEPNPDFETIYIMPRDCTAWVDELIVDTICIPEPSSIVLLAVAGLLLRRRR
ncbi:MAG: PEP-CTERM sorting domain-containing protein [Phycisphaerae bacterium]|nr:PEP-CTERM sorting domain-containing protein [Phycisphaerae bacterium]